MKMVTTVSVEYFMTGITSIVYQYCSTSIAAGCFILSDISAILNFRTNKYVENKLDCRYRKILRNTGNTSIADTGRFWKILVIPVLQILEDSGKYW
jgi:hypothetical protein